MRNITTQNVLAIVVSIALIAAISNSVSTVNAHTPNFLQYGALNHQEDQLYFVHDGSIYVNTGANMGIGNGQFMKITDLETAYNVNDALDRFYPYIQEDTNQFEVMPSQYSNVSLIYQFNDETLNFELLGAVQ